MSKTFEDNSQTIATPRLFVSTVLPSGPRWPRRAATKFGSVKCRIVKLIWDAEKRGADHARDHRAHERQHGHRAPAGGSGQGYQIVLTMPAP